MKNQSEEDNYKDLVDFLDTLINSIKIINYHMIYWISCIIKIPILIQN